MIYCHVLYHVVFLSRVISCDILSCMVLALSRALTRYVMCSVCRILEQEKEEHSALKSTWEMANDRFLETQRVQTLKMDKMINLLSSEHRQLFEEEVSKSKESVELLKPPSPATSRKFINRKTNKQFVGNRKQELSRVNKSSTSEHKLSLASFVTRKSNSSSSIGPSILDVSILSLSMSSLFVIRSPLQI